MSESAYFYRDRRGVTIHRRDCARRTTSHLPWYFAQGFDAAQLRQAMRGAPWLKACKICRPDEDNPSPTTKETP